MTSHFDDMYAHVPDELKQLKQWVCWEALPDGQRPGKMRKVPINAMTGGQAQSNNPDTWAFFKTAVTASARHNGIGFMFANGYFGIDIDNVEDAVACYRNGETENIVYEFIHTLQSYAEYSVSGKGIHVICRGSLPPQGRRKKNIEMYESGRFFIVTGDIASEYKDVSSCTESIKPLHEKYIGGGREPITPTADQVSLTEADIINLAGKSKQGAAFLALYNGNWESIFTSQSEADMSFCNMLAFWCRCDEQLMDGIFRSSGLMREKWDRKQSGTTYGMLTINKAIKGCAHIYEPKTAYAISIDNPPAQDKKKLYSLDDMGNAQRYVSRFGDDVRYSYTGKKWFYFDGRKWCADETGAIHRMADEVVESIKIEREVFLDAQSADADLDEAAKMFDKFIKSCRSNKSKTAMLKESEHHRPVRPAQFDRHIYLLNTPNGMVNLISGALEAHDRTKYITKITNAEFTDKTEAPLWDQFLQDIFNNDGELIRFIQKAVGYSLTGSTKEDCIFFCFGTGRNGKSTFLNTVADILGDFAINVQPETIMQKNNASNGPSSDIARLKGARFVTVPEPSEGMRINEGLIKQMTGGDTITASRKYEDEFEFKPEFKLWMPTNHKPRIYGTDIGIWSRIRLIPFNVRIPDEKIDRKLRQHFRREYAGILKWAVDGCLLWQREGLSMPKAVIAANAEYKSEMDILAAFLDECCELGEYNASASELFKAYMQWAKDNNEREMTSTRFGRELSKRFEKTRVAGGLYYHGIRLMEAHKPYQINLVYGLGH